MMKEHFINTIKEFAQVRDFALEQDPNVLYVTKEFGDKPSKTIFVYMHTPTGQLADLHQRLVDLRNFVPNKNITMRYTGYTENGMDHRAYAYEMKHYNV